VGSTASLVAGAGEAAAAAVVPASGGVVVEVESDGGQALGGRSHALGSSAKGRAELGRHGRHRGAEAGRLGLEHGLDLGAARGGRGRGVAAREVADAREQGGLRRWAHRRWQVRQRRLLRLRRRGRQGRRHGQGHQARPDDEPRDAGLPVASH
jgi:hypothetical protein